MEGETAEIQAFTTAFLLYQATGTSAQCRGPVTGGKLNQKVLVIVIFDTISAKAVQSTPVVNCLVCSLLHP
jgi:hypothetical protein